MKARKTERVLSVTAAVLFCSALVLYALLLADPLWAPYSVIYSPGVIIVFSLAADIFAVASFVLTAVFAVKKQPCLRTRAAKLRFVWNIFCFILLLYVLINGRD